MLIRDVLCEKGRGVISVGPEASVKEALALFVEHNIGSLPVVEASGQLIGNFSERDVVFGDHHDFERFHHRLMKEVMTAIPSPVAPTMPWPPPWARWPSTMSASCRWSRTTRWSAWCPSVTSSSRSMLRSRLRTVT